MTPILIAAALSAAAQAPAVDPAAAAPAAALAPAFSNTLVSVYPDGFRGRMWLHEDGSWRSISRHGTHTSGHWSVRKAQLCFKQARPVPIPFSYCTPLVRGEIGTSWAAKAPTGEPITVHLEAGHAGEPD